MFKNNIDKKIVKYGIKKLSFGIVSVAIGALVFLSGSASAHDENSLNKNSTIVHEKPKNLEITSETTNNLENKNAKESNNISNGITPTSVTENNIENKNVATYSTLTTEINGKSDNAGVTTSSNSSNNNLNVIDKRVDDSSDIANLLTKIINKNIEENKVTTEEVDNTEEPLEKGIKIISRLTSKYAEDIAKGYIGLEGGKYDSLIYKKAILDPDGDDDGDGIANKDELYIYKKDGRTYLGYDIHPRLADTDGDGLNDKVDKDKLIWNISARDMAMFINLVYENDKKIDDILKKQAPAGSLSNNIQKMTNNELGPYWRVKETFHQDNGLDAVLFETTNNFPFLKGDNIQVLAFAGTNVAQAGDLKADVALFFGNESNQSEAAIQLMKKIKNDSTITNLYITGHSLGGYLSLRATATAEKDKFGKYKQTYTFNAPKVKSGWFWGVPKDDVKISEELAKSGKIKNYYTDNDNIIPGNLQPENKISIGKSAGAHSSTSYFENRVNSNPDFNFGKRQGMDGVGYRDENINKLSIINPEKGTLSKTFLPTLVDDRPVSIMIGDKLKDKDIINKVNRNLLPVNTKLSLVYKDELTSLGTKRATVRVVYLDDNSSNDINVPISVNEADKKELISVVNAAQKLVESVVELSDKTKKSVENYNLAKSTLTEKLKEAEATISNTLSPQLAINNITRELAGLGVSVINSRTALELTEAGKYEPKLLNDEKLLLHQGSSLNTDDVFNKIVKENLPQNINYEILNSTDFGELGDVNARVRVTYSDGSNDIINVPIRVYTDSKGEPLVQEENPELVISEKGEPLVQEENPELVISEKGELLVQEEKPELVIREKGEPLVQEENPELVISEKGEPLVQEENPELVISEKDEPLVQEENPELVISEKGEPLVQEATPELVISEKGEPLVQEEKPELVISEKGDPLVQEENPELVINEKGEPLVQEENPELVISEKGEPLVHEENPELVISEKGELLVQEENPELVISEKGEPLVQEENPELVISEKGDPLVQEATPELVISEKGEALVQEENPKATLELLNSSKFGVEVELLANINNISLNVKKIENNKQIEMISKQLSVEKDKIRVLDLKLSKDNNEVQLKNNRIVRIALLENESSEIKIYHVEKNGTLTLIPSEVKNGIVQFNINHFSLFAIVDFSKTVPRNENDKPKEISLDAKKEMSTTNKINDQENTTINNKDLNSKSKDVTQVVEGKYNVKNNLENSKSNSKVYKHDSLNNNFKKSSILPKTGENSSNTIPIVTGLGLIIGVLGIRKYNR
ncbi:MAG: Rib/alpha-like domain-containing protein [Gemella haemolysans]|uniref:Rib/alpha-like domain-containing protein n=1 Tax=Gemella haemolysans TaxID=1379 RepID=UPI002907504F|nr:Rib/alpha-like domain-containing protein [Gemella haemolysans]MDU6573750.1 Rib/alpha-like domain-containing protein [Gemella haemolysans]